MIGGRYSIKNSISTCTFFFMILIKITTSIKAFLITLEIYVGNVKNNKEHFIMFGGYVKRLENSGFKCIQFERILNINMQLKTY